MPHKVTIHTKGVCVCMCVCKRSCSEWAILHPSSDRFKLFQPWLIRNLTDKEFYTECVQLAHICSIWHILIFVDFCDFTFAINYRVAIVYLFFFFLTLRFRLYLKTRALTTNHLAQLTTRDRASNFPAQLIWKLAKIGERPYKYVKQEVQITVK